jgi:hypothetical protein
MPAMLSKQMEQVSLVKCRVCDAGGNCRIWENAEVWATWQVKGGSPRGRGDLLVTCDGSEEGDGQEKFPERMGTDEMASLVTLARPPEPRIPFHREVREKRRRELVDSTLCQKQVRALGWEVNLPQKVYFSYIYYYNIIFCFIK